MMILIRFFKRNFASIINKSKDFVIILLNNSFFSKAKNNMVINIISYTFLGIIFYLFDVSIFNTIFCENDSSCLFESPTESRGESDDENNNEEIKIIKNDVLDNAMEKGKELNINIAGNNELVGSNIPLLEASESLPVTTSPYQDSVTVGQWRHEGLSSSFIFLFLNKLPSWLKALLKYIALYFIILFIVKIIGYKSNILIEIYSQFNVYLVYFLKLLGILNFLVIIYYILRLYILTMYANNKEHINPEDYHKFIKKELIELKEIAIKLSPEKLAIIYKHYYKLILLYSSITLFGLTMMVLIQ